MLRSWSDLAISMKSATYSAILAVYKVPLPTHPGAPQGKNFQNDSGIALVRLLHQPPFVPAGCVMVRGGAHGAWLGAVGRVDIRADLHLEMLQRGAIARFEQIVENPAALGFGVIDQQPRGGSRTRRAEPVEDSASAVAVEDDIDLLAANGRAGKSPAPEQAGKASGSTQLARHAAMKQIEFHSACLPSRTRLPIRKLASILPASAPWFPAGRARETPSRRGRSPHRSRSCRPPAVPHSTKGNV